MEYNWNNLSIGHQEFNSSLDFFSRKHLLHEKNLELNANVDSQKVKKDSNELILKETKAAQKNQTNEIANKENISVNKTYIDRVQQIKNKNFKDSVITTSNSSIASSLKKLEVKSLVDCKPFKILEDKKNKPEMAIVAPRQRAVVVKDNNLYRYAEQQRKRKEELLKKVEEEEKAKMKVEFHAKPAPKFKEPVLKVKESKRLIKQVSAPQLMINQKPHNQATNPSKISRFVAAPPPLIPSMLTRARLQKKTDNMKNLIEKYADVPVKFTANKCKILNKEPFRPALVSQRSVEAKPFQLALADRAEQRKEFDAKLTSTIAKKKAQEETKKKKEDLEFRQFLRQKTQFKAKPNPFK